MELELDDYICGNLIRRKGKSESFSRQMEVYVEVKQKKSMSASNVAESIAEDSFFISTDIWFHIAMHIKPEDIKTFALICPQTAQLVNSRRFWRNIYRRYCQNSVNSQWNLNLPLNMQPDNVLANGDSRFLRAHVIEALFYCHGPMKQRLEKGYSLDWLVNRSYVSSWQQQVDCVWVICYKFWNHLETGVNILNAEDKTTEVDDWESLAERDNKSILKQNQLKFVNANEGVSILVVCCSQFVPFPTQLAYQESRYRLKSTRELLCKDMSAVNLELDLIDSINSSVLTIRYPQIKMYKVLPWWHPKFKTFIK